MNALDIDNCNIPFLLNDDNRTGRTPWRQSASETISDCSWLMLELAHVRYAVTFQLGEG
jgi:hypothetical protein